jgi:hypothetical protein
MIEIEPNSSSNNSCTCEDLKRAHRGDGRRCAGAEQLEREPVRLELRPLVGWTLVRLLSQLIDELIVVGVERVVRQLVSGDDRPGRPVELLVHEDRSLAENRDGAAQEWRLESRVHRDPFPGEDRAESCLRDRTAQLRVTPAQLLDDVADPAPAAGVFDRFARALRA